MRELLWVFGTLTLLRFDELHSGTLNFISSQMKWKRILHKRIACAAVSLTLVSKCDLVGKLGDAAVLIAVTMTLELFSATKMFQTQPHVYKDVIQQSWHAVFLINMHLLIYAVFSLANFLAPFLSLSVATGSFCL